MAKKRKKKKEKVLVVYKAHAHIEVLSSATKLGTWNLWRACLVAFYLFSLYFLAH